MRFNRSFIFQAMVFCAFLFSSAVLSAPTGLNVIPTADILDRGVLDVEIQVSEVDLHTGNEFDDELETQIGLGGNTEFGIDTSLHEGGTWGNIKYRLFKETSRRPALAFGIQNVGTGSDDQPYIVGFKSFHGTRLHVGGIELDDDNQLMLGLDRSLSDLWTVQADYISGDDNFLTFGASYGFGSFSISAAYLIDNEEPKDHGFQASFGWAGDVGF